MLKNPCKATGFYYDSHGCNLRQGYLTKGWLAMLKGYEVSLEGLFQHICLPYQKQVLQDSAPF